MAIDLKHALAVGGIAVVALGAGIGIARATGDEEPPKPPANAGGVAGRAAVRPGRRRP